MLSLGSVLWALAVTVSVIAITTLLHQRERWRYEWRQRRIARQLQRRQRRDWLKRRQ